MLHIKSIEDLCKQYSRNVIILGGLIKINSYAVKTLFVLNHSLISSSGAVGECLVKGKHSVAECESK